MSNPPDKVGNAALAAYRQRAAARVAEIKGDLAKWLESRDDVVDSVNYARALLETALDRHVSVHEANGFDLIEASYRRALKRCRGKLQ